MSSIVTVSQLNRYLSLKIGGDLKLKSITVRGELSDFKIHYKSGHAYFSLKDEGAVLKGVMFRGKVERLGFMPQSGMDVLCAGSIEVYEAGGVYQIIASELIPAGVGARFMQINALKEKLEKQGLFAPERKKALPELPKKIAVVTSLGGAALQDVLNILGRRYPLGSVEIYAAQVQGKNAPETIADALRCADSSGADVIILTRGGGSFEELMPFNSEAATAAVAACKTPVITAVGHETDTTLVDYAADMRAPTPSAAAELCAPTAQQLSGAAEIMENRLNTAFLDYISRLDNALERLDMRLKACTPDAAIDNLERTLEGFAGRLDGAWGAYINRLDMKLTELDSRLEALSPFNVLERGYTITLKDKRAVTSPEQIKPDDTVEIRFKDFVVTAQVKNIRTITE